MALLDEIEPPSQNCEEKTNNLKDTSKTKHQFDDNINQFRTNKLRFLADIANKSALMTRESLKSVRNFILSNKYLPHCALITMGLLVVISNFKEKIVAASYYEDFVSAGPNTEYSVASSVDQYTPIIGGDSELIKKQIIATTTSTTEDGFVNTTGSFTTELTSREIPLPDNTNGTVDYIIRNGDTLTALGWKFEVKLATLKYVNDIENVDSIRPGMKIKVPQRGYEVPASLIAKEEADRKAKLAASSRNTVTRNSSNTRGAAKVRTNPGSSNNGYPYGYCTYYVATRRFVPSSWGDAKQWLNSAQRAGYSTGSAPAAGSIVVTRESWWGHVAYVESVNGNEITISEMNARGWGVTSRRTIPASGGVVRGYIY